MAAKTYTVQARYAGNDRYAPSVAQTMDVTTTYELTIPAEITGAQGITQLAVSENMSLEGREVRISIADAGNTAEGAGSAYDPNTGLLTLAYQGASENLPATVALPLQISGKPVSGEQIAAISRNTPNKALELSLGEPAGNGYVCRVNFKAELAELPQVDSNR